MAEAFLNALSAKQAIHAESAGLEPREINPDVIEVMKEKDFDLSDKSSDGVFDFYKEGRLYDFVITVCDEAIEEQCPIFPGIAKRMHWPFSDPAKVTGTRKQRLEQIRKIRDDIEKKINQWLETDLRDG